MPTKPMKNGLHVLGFFKSPISSVSSFFHRYTPPVKILLAMSGGVDSSVCAFLLKEAGHDVIGVRFALWNDPLAPAHAQILPNKCCTTEAAFRTQQVASSLGIPLHVVNLERDFKRIVVDRYLKELRLGLTPNPCVNCNRDLKFSSLLALAKKLHCDGVATGHYARIAKRTVEGKPVFRLLQAKDKTKDQSYYLYRLGQNALSKILFPLGALEKKNVLSLARHFGVPIDEQYRESQDLCFFPEKSPQAFYGRYLKKELREGSIVHRDGTKVGTHRGLPLYTIGQRRGLGIGGLKIPLEVVGKDMRRCRLIVAERDTEQAKTIRVKDLTWTSAPPANRAILTCRTRSLSKKIRGSLTFRGKAGVFTPIRPLPLQSPGQSLVLYRGEEVVGGGFIAP